jgi:tetratricopeptide (TPR) repeat protein
MHRYLILAALLLAASAQADESVDALNKRMMQLYTDGYYEQAIPLAAQIVAELEKSGGTGSAAVASALNNEAELYSKLHRYPEAEALYKRSLSIRQAVLGPDDPNTQKSLSRLAEVMHAEGKDVLPPPQARPQPQPIQRPVMPPPPQPRPAPQQREPAVSQQEFNHGIELNQQSVQLGNQGHYAEAIPLGVQALAIFEKAFGPNDANVAIGSGNLAQLYVAASQYDKAEPLYKRAVAILEKHPEKEKDLAMELAGMADLYARERKYADAEPYYRRCIPLLDKYFGPDGQNSVAMVNNFANELRSQGKDPEKEPTLKGRWEKTAQLSLPRSRTLGGGPAPAASLKDVNPADFDRSQALDGKLYGLLAGKDYAEALPVAQEQQALLEKMYGPDNPAVAVNLDNLATIYRNLGRPAEAEPLVKRSQAIRDANKAIDQINH